ncbi:DUF2997 domain-containing protein [Paenibacillus sp. FSL H8-0537]|uniref:DUF2997 domain-containing protein n=1 Tax=Paenibacillus sp. FSL H8-0537 TaxID=2921399 RepID=UPI00310113DB
MSSKQIRVRIYPDGKIEADVLGIKGKGCTDYISILEQLLDAETVDSEYTAEYYESEQTITAQKQIHSTKQNNTK